LNRSGNRVINHYEIDIDQDKTVEEVMKNVYYSHLSDEGFDEQVSEIYRFHEELILKIVAGELLPKLEEDPLTGEKRDYSDDEFRNNVNQIIDSGDYKDY